MLRHASTANPRHRRLTAVALIALCLSMQSVLAFWVTPMAIAHGGDSDRVSIALCTLQGMQYVDVDMPALLGDENEICPALELDHLAATGVVADYNSLTLASFVAEEPTFARITGAASAKRYQPHISRAPPVV